MAAKMTEALANAWLASGGDDLGTLLDDCFIKIFAGTVPATASEALGGGYTLLATITESDDGSTGLTWATPAVAGVLSKTPSEDWSGTAVAAGTKSFFRIVTGADTGMTLATTEKRLQGTIGVNSAFDMVVNSLSTSISDVITLNSGELIQPLTA